MKILGKIIIVAFFVGGLVFSGADDLWPRQPLAARFRHAPRHRGKKTPRGGAVAAPPGGFRGSIFAARRCCQLMDRIHLESKYHWLPDQKTPG